MNGGRHVIVVDDQADIRDLAVMVLAGAGYRVSAAADGAEALDRLHADPADLVLLDINMPGMDGWETLRLIRADDELAGVPVVMFSIKNEFRDKVHGMQEGALDYITKPFEVDELVERVRRIFESIDSGAAADRPAPHPVP